MLTLSKNGPISVKQLKRALHVAKKINYTTEKYIFDHEATNCSEICNQEYCSTSTKCMECPYAVYKKEVKEISVYEQSKFGSQAPLQKYTLLTYMSLHLLHPDANGMVYVDIDDLAGVLNCNPTTVSNNLSLLVKKGFILMSNGRYNTERLINITGYKNIFDKYKNNGNGYIVFTEELLQLLINEPHINTIRFTLQLYINEYLNNSKRTIFYHKKENYLAWLPEYCRSKTLMRAMSSELFQALFTSQTKGRNNDVYIVSLNEKYTSYYVTTHIDKLHSEEIREYVSSINADAEATKMDVNEKELMDIALIVRQYPISYVKAAINSIFKDYFINKVADVKSLGALIRTRTKYISMHYPIFT